MRKIILNVAVSLDGYIEGPNGEYDWCFTDQDYGMKDFLGSVDAIFIGRKSYEVLMKEEGGSSMFGRKKLYVFSNTLQQREDYELISGNALDIVKTIKSKPGKNIWLFGGASLTSALLKAGLVNELSLAVHPILLGAGKLLFENGSGKMKTRLLSSKAYETGLVSLHYQVDPKLL
jgi:dihydrofolate reductase